MERISAHISYVEAVKSQEAERRGLDNAPNDTELAAMKLVAEKCFEPLRAYHGKPIGISSFFRSKRVNAYVGGSATSDHVKGSAIDIDADLFDNGISNADIFRWLRDNVEFDQLIWEYGTDENPAWVHVSHRATKNRRQVLRAVMQKRGNASIARIIPYTP
jgi:D-alanyl-D-alanine dipeptidase